jgi:hypothetical protein
MVGWEIGVLERLSTPPSKVKHRADRSITDSATPELL